LNGPTRDYRGRGRPEGNVSTQERTNGSWGLRHAPPRRRSLPDFPNGCPAGWPGTRLRLGRRRRWCPGRKLAGRGPVRAEHFFGRIFVGEAEPAVGGKLPVGDDPFLARANEVRRRQVHGWPPVPAGGKLRQATPLSYPLGCPPATRSPRICCTLHPVSEDRRKAELQRPIRSAFPTLLPCPALPRRPPCPPFPRPLHSDRSALIFLPEPGIP
jgi:hypothetical protein